MRKQTFIVNGGKRVKQQSMVSFNILFFLFVCKNLFKVNLLCYTLYHVVITCNYLDYVDLDARKPIFRGLRTTKGPTSLHICSLIRAFVIVPYIYKNATGEILIF